MKRSVNANDSAREIHGANKQAHRPFKVFYNEPVSNKGGKMECCICGKEFWLKKVALIDAGEVLVCHACLGDEVAVRRLMDKSKKKGGNDEVIVGATMRDLPVAKKQRTHNRKRRVRVQKVSSESAPLNGSDEAKGGN